MPDPHAPDPGRRQVIATAGHVDHGKSTLVRALTGMEPDRWAEERRRGMTLDLGFAWTRLPGANGDGVRPGDPPAPVTVAFVDVPGHHRFLANMLAGVGPVPAALLVVAADEGWRRQTDEHVAALDALGVRHALLAVTRTDLGDPAPVIADAQRRLARTSLGQPPAVAVCAPSGAGLDELRAALAALVTSIPEPDSAAPVRFWVDRSFSLDGVGTVVTGTLGAGRLRAGDELELTDGRPVRIRGLQSLGQPVTEAAGVTRVAVNLRGVDRSALARGDALLTPGSHLRPHVLDVLLEPIAGSDGPQRLTRLPAQLVVHIGSAAVSVRLRLFGEEEGAAYARLTLAQPLPLRRDDLALLRDPGRQEIAARVRVLDVDPPPLARRGDARARRDVLAEMHRHVDPVAELERRGPLPLERLTLLGLLPAPATLPAGTRLLGRYVVADSAWRGWQRQLHALVERDRKERPLSAGIPLEAARRALDLPDQALVEHVARAASLVVARGLVTVAQAQPALPDDVQCRFDELRDRLRQQPFAAPDAAELAEAGLTPPLLAAAERAGLILRIDSRTGVVVLLPDALDEAVRRLAALPQPFSVPEAKDCLGASRRVVIPLLERLDALRRTRRLDATRRIVLPGRGQEDADGGSRR